MLRVLLTIAATAADADPPPGEGVRLDNDLINSCSGKEAKEPCLLLPITYLEIIFQSKSHTKCFTKLIHILRTLLFFHLC